MPYQNAKAAYAPSKPCGYPFLSLVLTVAGKVGPPGREFFLLPGERLPVNLYSL